MGEVKPGMWMPVHSAEIPAIHGYYCSIQLSRYIQHNKLYLATGKTLGYAYPFEIDIFNSIILGFTRTNELRYMSHTSHGEYHGYGYPSIRYKWIYLTRIYGDK